MDVLVGAAWNGPRCSRLEGGEEPRKGRASSEAGPQGPRDVSGKAENSLAPPVQSRFHDGSLRDGAVQTSSSCPLKCSPIASTHSHFLPRILKRSPLPWALLPCQQTRAAQESTSPVPGTQ